MIILLYAASVVADAEVGYILPLRCIALTTECGGLRFLRSRCRGVSFYGIAKKIGDHLPQHEVSSESR